MHGTNWNTFFRRIPVNLHDSLALTVSTGAEIVLQSIVKLEADAAIVRGRMAGTTDGARVVVIPYSMLVYVAFNRRMSDADVQTVFGAADPMAPAIDLVAAAEAATAAAAEEPTVPADAPAVNAPPAMPSKSMLLAKLRARLADGNGPAGQ